MSKIFFYSIGVWISPHKSCVARQENILTHLRHYCWHVPHDSTLLIVYFMSEIKLAPHKEAHWCHQGAVLQHLTARCVSNPNPGFVRRRGHLSEASEVRGFFCFNWNYGSVAGDFPLVWKKCPSKGCFLTQNMFLPFEIAILFPFVHFFANHSENLNPFYAPAGDKGWFLQWRYWSCWCSLLSSRSSVLRCHTGDLVQSQMFNQPSVSNRYKRSNIIALPTRE